MSWNIFTGKSVLSYLFFELNLNKKIYVKNQLIDYII